MMGYKIKRNGKIMINIYMVKQESTLDSSIIIIKWNK